MGDRTARPFRELDPARPGLMVRMRTWLPRLTPMIHDHDHRASRSATRPSKRGAANRLGRCLLALIAAALVLGGCKASGEARFEIAPGAFETAFDASRQALREYQFELERVDAAEGVITTAPKATAGIATPWHREQSTLGQEFDDLLNQHERAIRIEFTLVPAGTEQASSGVVRATVFRLQSPGVRPASRAVGSTTTTIDPKLTERGIWAGQLVPLGEDPQLAVRLARRIEAIMSGMSGMPQASAAPSAVSTVTAEPAAP